MKRLFTLLLTTLFLFSAQAAVWAEPNPPATRPQASSQEVIFLIDRGLKENLSEIRTKASGLDADQRYDIYSDKKKEPLVGFLLNFLVGLGIGSFVIGDSEGGITQLAGELIGLGVYILGATMSAFMGTNNPMGIVVLLAGIAGLVTMLVYRIGGWLRPFDYTKDYNAELQNALSIGSTDQSLAPYYQNRSDMTGQTYHEAGLVYAFSF